MKTVRTTPTWLLVAQATLCLGLFGLWQTRDGMASALDSDLAAATGGQLCTKIELDGQSCANSKDVCNGTTTFWDYQGVVICTDVTGTPKVYRTQLPNQICAGYRTCSSCPSFCGALVPTWNVSSCTYEACP